MCDEAIQGFQIRFDPNCDLPLFVSSVETDIKRIPTNYLSKSVREDSFFAYIIANNLTKTSR